MNGNLNAAAQRAAQGAQDGNTVEFVERASVESDSDVLSRSIDTYLRACGVTDGGFRQRLIDRLVSAPAPAPLSPDGREAGDAASPCDGPDVRALQAAIDAALTAELELDEGDPDQPAQLARALVGAAARAGSAFALEPGLRELRSVPAPRPTRMPTQDLSAWTPVRALASLLTRIRPPATA